MTSTAPEAPVTLAGRYELRARIGRGGQALVYRAWDAVLERTVAVKILRDSLEEDAELNRFRAEARTLARLDHPGLVSIYDTGIHDGQPYLVMELVEGTTLARLLAARRLSTVECLSIAAALADVLAHVHGRGITHRDVKPSNVLIDHENNVLLADFGVARTSASTQTAPGSLIGTAAYLSPEQVRGEEVTPACDVYALGLLLIEGLIGRRVYTGAPGVAALARLLTPPPVDDVPAPLRPLVAAMTAPDPRERSTAAEAAAALRGHLGVDVEAETAQLARPFPAQASGPGEVPRTAAIPLAGGSSRPVPVASRTATTTPRLAALATPRRLAAVAATVVVLAGLGWAATLLGHDPATGAGVARAPLAPVTQVPTSEPTAVRTDSSDDPTSAPTERRRSGRGAAPGAAVPSSARASAGAGADDRLTEAQLQAIIELVRRRAEQQQQQSPSASPSATASVTVSPSPSAGPGKGGGGRGRGGSGDG